MKLRRTYRFHGLKRPRIRQTWNKYNLYNLQTNLFIPRLITKTFFQQKWVAKALARGYHGEHIKERLWTQMFSRRLQSVVEMDPRYMAEHDGSEQAAGRGSGRELRPGERSQATNLRRRVPTPYMQMAFAPMERRLDIAVFRAMFASSARQARQFVVHGAVKVNGVKMRYPGYLLNPGDMFQVEVEKVLFATGAKKPTPKAIVRKAAAAAEAKEGAEQEGEAPSSSAAEAEAAESEPATAEAAEVEEGGAALGGSKRAAKELPYLVARARHILAGADDGGLTVKRKKALRKFVKDAQKTIAKAAGNKKKGGAAAVAVVSDNVVDELADMLEKLSPSSSSSSSSSSAAPASGEADGTVAKQSIKGGSRGRDKIANLTEEERQRFQALLARDAENPVDPSRPYATPWRPRPFMRAFAFIPRYLEVNQNVCAAVYLRHPVARPGLAEVPTPFPPEIGQLAFNWYLRRR